MKMALLVLISVLALSGYTLGQLPSRYLAYDVENLTSIAGTNVINSINPYGAHVGGMLKTATGRLHVLVAIVRFRDDNATTDDWPDLNSLPAWAQNYVNATVPNDGIFQYRNLSDLFNRASGGNGTGTLGAFQITGDVYYIVSEHDRSWYHYDTDVNDEVFRRLDDPLEYNVDFRKYDNWRFMNGSNYYQHQYIPFNPSTGAGGDDKLDMMFICYRNHYNNPKAFPYRAIFLSGFTSNEGVSVSGDDGITITNLLVSVDPARQTGICPAHEYGHYIFGGAGNSDAHLDGRYDIDHTRLDGNTQNRGLMNSNGAYDLSSYERYRAGWLNPTFINYNVNNFVLHNTHAANQAILIPLRYESNNLKEYYLIENLQSTNDYPANSPIPSPYNVTSQWEHIFRHGIFVYHIVNENLTLPMMSNIDIECADGKWMWKLTAGASTPSLLTDDIIAKDYPSIDGRDELNYIPITVGTSNNWYMPIKSDGIHSDRRYTRNAWSGDNEDYFRVGETEVFSTWSNPSTRIKSGSSWINSNVGFKVESYNTTTHDYNISIAADETGLLDFPPSKPLNLKVAAVNSAAVLTWAANTEPDMQTGGHYKIYYAQTNGSDPTSYGLLTTINAYNGTTPVTTFTDDARAVGTGTKKVYYKITAVDNTNKESVFSNDCWIPWNGNFMKENDAEEEVVAYTNNLSKNFPDPFNPETRINYSIQNDSRVLLQVFNLLGQRVATLVDDVKPAGNYSVSFNAKDLTSGIYIYTLSTEKFSVSKKMLLMK